MAITPRSIDAGVGIGEIFVDKYRVDAILGHGGMGVVAACTHLALNERVAIKMLRKDVLDDADAVERFMREAQAAVKLKSEFVARVTDVGRSRSNIPYMVMEYLEGHDLGELLDERGSLGMRWAIELTLQACEALAEAHSLGIIHRDVKPTNLFVTWRPDGSSLVKVLDFGISKALTGHAMQLTQTQSLLGTPAYMSPEQMRSARMVDARTDIWSLGTVLYEMIEGRRPFEAESFSEMCVKVAVDPPAAMKTAPPELQQVVLRCLEKAPEQRYISMAELARDLVPFSSDPHQAQILVERMARTLRRSQVQPIEWSGASSASSNPVLQLWTGERQAETAAGDSGPTRLARSSASTPAVVPDGGSGPTPMPLAERGSGHAPAPASERTSSRVRAEPPRRGTGSQPALSETLAVARPRSRRGIVIATAVVAAAAIGVVISLLSSRAPPTQPAATPAAARGTAGTAGPHNAAQPGNTAEQRARGPADTAAGANRGTTAANAIEAAGPAHDPAAQGGATGAAAQPRNSADADARTGTADTAVIVPPPDVTSPAPHTGTAGATGRDAKPARGSAGNRPAGRPSSGTKPAGGATPTRRAAKDCVFADAHGDACVDTPGSGGSGAH